MDRIFACGCRLAVYGADRRLCCQYSNVVTTQYGTVSMLYVSVLMPVLMVRNLANLSDSPAGTSQRSPETILKIMN